MLTDVTTDMVITKEETFGPVAPCERRRCRRCSADRIIGVLSRLRHRLVQLATVTGA